MTLILDTSETDYPQAFGCRDLPDGRVLVLYDMLFNMRLCVGPQREPWYDRGFCYPKESAVDALLALAEWDGNGDPPGAWIKEVGTT